MHIDRESSLWRRSASNDGRPLVFARSTEGLAGAESEYMEILQEYRHLANIHWRNEYRAHCRINRLGNWEPIVSMTQAERNGVSLASFKRGPLEK